MKSENFTFIKTDKKLVKLYFDEITIIRSLGNYVEILTTENKKYVYYKSLKDLIENLPDEFMRVHNSHIVNLNAVTRYIKGEGGYLTMSDGSTVDVSRSRKELLMQRLQPHKE